MAADILLQFAPWLAGLEGPLAYLGIMALSFFGSATIVLPVIPAVIIVFGAGALLNPWLVGIAAGVGAALGELVGYALGRGGNYAAKSKQKKYLQKAERLMEKYRAVVVIFAFAVTPLPFDVVGILCGVTKYDIKKFMVATVAGKVVKFTLIALAAFYGIEWLSATFL